jgi:hypothetical protein
MAAVCYNPTMSAVPFDTLKLADRLQAGGFTAEQAHAAASALADVTSAAELVTKPDLLATRQDLKRDLVELEQRLTIRLGGMLVIAVGVILAAIRYLPAPPH